jgi:hypothetical protein
VEVLHPKDLLLALSQRVGTVRLIGFAALGAALALLLLLKALPYSSCRLTFVSAEEIGRPPTPDFTLGPLSWPVSRLKNEPALAPFRESLRTTCGDATGLKAATCAAEAVARRSPFGVPSTEFVDRDFNPWRHFEQHMAGEPGHCLTRSAIVATQLLAAGIPARVVQLIPPTGGGHTVVGVWDETSGWTLVDPTLGGTVVGPEGRGSTAVLLKRPTSARWRPFASASPAPPAMQDRQRFFRNVLSGNLVYPEPWLYLRLGKKVAHWPFRGYYVHTGPTFVVLGPAQNILIWTIPVLGLVGVSFIALGWRERAVIRGAKRQSGTPEAMRRLADSDTVPRA